jgi:hypothetical protein
MRFVICGLALLAAACGGGAGTSPPTVPPVTGEAPDCAPGAEPITVTGAVTSADAKTYRMHPFRVAEGTGRVELSYGWTERSPLPSTPGVGGFVATTLDLGLWDQRGYRSVEGFRGWSGSRQGRIDREQPPVFVQADIADRGYLPGPIETGVWFAELGVGASSQQGADWTLVIECKAAVAGTTPADDPVDRTHVARAEAGWYHGDFHMHAYHSNPEGPDWSTFVSMAREAKLEFLMVTEYVTTQHWRTLGAVQRANPDLVIWPGREVITYFGHVMGHGETPNVVDYRHGFEDVNIGELQALMKADGALFQINHPTSFPPPVFSNFCRGCYFELGDQVDWSQVDTIEILNGPALVNADDIGVPLPQPQIENPFLITAIQLWEQQLTAGHRITAVSGSDSKGVEPDDAEKIRAGYGSSATAVYATALSRDALIEAIKAGRAYVRTRGVDRSPALEFTAKSSDGRSVMFGETLEVGATEPVRLTVTVTGGSGQILTYVQNGVPILAVPIVGDSFTHNLPLATRNLLTEGPLGTFWRIETRNAQSRTTVGNPIFLKGP